MLRPSRFVASSEAKALTDVQSCHFVMDFAADCFGATIATLGPRELREIVFEIIPRKVSIDASKARWIIEENRPFYAFLKREYALEQADACLRVLGGDAVKKLDAALSDSSNFGMAKSAFRAALHEAPAPRWRSVAVRRAARESLQDAWRTRP